jgi:hypothetical protein
MMKYQFQRFGNMKTIRDDHFRIIGLQRNRQLFTPPDGIYFIIINYHPDPEKTKQPVLFQRNNDMVRGSYDCLF